MATIHADTKTRPFALQIAKILAARPKDFGLKRSSFGVRPPTGAADEIVVTVGTLTETQTRYRYKLAVGFTVMRRGRVQRFRVDNTLASRTPPTRADRWECLAHCAAHKLAPYFRVTPRTAAARTIHVSAYQVQDEPLFRRRIVARLRAQGFRTKVTLGLSDTTPDPTCWGFLMLPFVGAYRWRDGKLAMSPAIAHAGGHVAKTKIRATVEPDLSEAKATALLADKLADWYGQLAATAQG